MQMNITLPSAVEAAIARLEHAGYEAFAVGGCVRDTLLGRVPNDWDITTSALPAETVAVFADCRTMEIGLKHGTLTVILNGMPLEITTYRHDGEYADNRHPVSVTFTHRVEDDLSRRDFTVNAMAYHPTRGLVDLFGGREDICRGIIACVGDPTTRFGEDGLRILRAIRFASVLDFSIDKKTADAVHNCRHLLRNIAAERIREELCKLICGKGAERVLRDFSDVIAEIIPELGACVGFEQNSRYHCFDVYEHSIRALGYSRSTDLVTRLAILLHDVGKPLCYTEDENGGHFKGHGDAGTELTAEIMRRLRFDNATAESVTALVRYHDRDIPAEPRSVKRLMRKLSDENILRLMEIKRCDRVTHAPAYNTPSQNLVLIPELMRQIRADNECFSLKDLAVNGHDLLALGFSGGHALGIALNSLLEDVIDGKLPNTREALLQAAKNYL